MKNEDILELKFYCEDLGKELTIKDFLKELLSKLWHEMEVFSGKRPFGNSGWEDYMLVPLIKAGVIPGDLDDEDCINSADHPMYYQLIADLIKSL